MANIIRVLCTKFRSSPQHFKAALRAALFLIPVFGIHYVFYVSKKSILDTCDLSLEIVLYLGIAVECLQGAFVSIIFCFMNGEVSNLRILFKFFTTFHIHPSSFLLFTSQIHTLVRRSLRRWIRKHQAEIVTEEHDMGRLSTIPTAPPLDSQTDYPSTDSAKKGEGDVTTSI